MDFSNLFQLISLPTLLMAGLILPHIVGFLILGQQRQVRLAHKEKGLVMHGYYGYCIYAYFLGGLVAIKRGQLLVGLFACLFWLVTWTLLGYILAWYYNKTHLLHLLDHGWSFADTEENNQKALHFLGFSAAETETTIQPA